MLKKYQNFKKISRSSECCFYQANLRQDTNKVLIKRFKHACSWNELLKGRATKIESTEHFFPKVLQIFRSNGEYFVVYERPKGPSLNFINESIKKQLVDFYSILNQILNSLERLSQQITDLYLYPEWIYLHRTGIKICHFEPYFTNEKQQKEADHVFLYELTNRSQQEQNQKKRFFSFQRIKNLNFNLGYVAYHLLTGRVTSWKFEEQDYERQIKQIQLNAQMRIVTQTGDEELAGLVSNLLCCQDDSIPFKDNKPYNDLSAQFFSFIKRKNVSLKCCKKQSFRIVQVSFQKMMLQKQMSKIKIQKKKKGFRHCCRKTFQDQQNPEWHQQDKQKFKIVQKNQKLEQNATFKTAFKESQSKVKLQSRSPFASRQIINRHKINFSCHLPILKTQRKQNFMVKNIKFHHNRSTMFRTTSNKAIKTVNSCVKTRS